MRYVSQELRAEADGLQGRTVAPGGDVVLGATGDEVLDVLGYGELGLGLKVVKAQRFQLHSYLRIKVGQERMMSLRLAELSEIRRQ